MTPTAATTDSAVRGGEDVFWEGFLEGLKYGGVASGVLVCLFVVRQILKIIAVALKAAEVALIGKAADDDD